MGGSRSENDSLTRDGAPAPWARAALDIFEKAFVVFLFSWLAWTIFSAVGNGANWFNLVQLAAEALNVIFILVRRRATVVSYRLVDWLVSIGATTSVLMVRPASLPPLGPPALAGALLLAGLVIQISAKLALRRGFGLTPANRGLTISGPYRYVRHPMYLGYFFGWVGFYLLNPSLWNTIVYCACLFFQWRRIAGEERVLALDPGHAAYRAEVRYRVIPGVW